MANTSSAKKALRVSKRKRIVNLRKIDAYKAARKEVRELVKKGDVEAAKKGIAKAFKALDKAAKDNILHKNTAARYKSRLSKEVNKASK